VERQPAADRAGVGDMLKRSAGDIERLRSTSGRWDLTSFGHAERSKVIRVFGLQ